MTGILGHSLKQQFSSLWDVSNLISIRVPKGSDPSREYEYISDSYIGRKAQMTLLIALSLEIHC